MTGGQVLDSAVAGFAYSCAPELSSGTGNITDAPRIPGKGPTPFALSLGSPCINTGTNLPWMPSARDLAGNPRTVGYIVDMGAYESSLVGSLFVVH